MSGFWYPSWASKNRYQMHFFQVAPERRPRSAQEASKSAPRAPKSVPRAPKSDQNVPRGRPRCLQKGYFFVHFLVFPGFSIFFRVFYVLPNFSAFFFGFLRFSAFLCVLMCFSVILRVSTFFWVILSRSLCCQGRFPVFFECFAWARSC